MSVLCDTLHLALISLLSDWLYPQQGAPVEVRDEVPGVCVAELLSILLPREVRRGLPGCVAVEGSNPPSLHLLGHRRAVNLRRI